MIRFHSVRSLCALLAGCLLFPVCSQADLFKYKDGRVVYGRVVGEPSKVKGEKGIESDVWIVEVDEGIYIQVVESELVLHGHEPLSEARTEYSRLVASDPNTVEAHRERAAWCINNGLSDLARAHREYSIDIAPNSDQVRAAAGYLKDSNGRWQKEELIMGLERGKVKVGSRWRFPESIAIEQAEKQRSDVLANAASELRRWHFAASNTNSSAKVRADALQKIRQIDDPLTAGAIADYLLNKRGSRKELPLDLKLVYVQLLARIQTPESAGALSQVAMNDVDLQVRNACLDALSQSGRETAISVFSGYLGSPENGMINRAAEGLSHLGATHAVLPLINALVTTHSVQAGSAGMNASPTSGSFSIGGEKKVQVQLENPSVRGALTHLTSQNYGYDQARWMDWYASVFYPPAHDLRRDP